MNKFYIYVRTNPDQYVYSRLWHSYLTTEDAMKEAESWLDRHYPNNWWRDVYSSGAVRYYEKEQETIIVRITRSGVVW